MTLSLHFSIIEHEIFLGKKKWHHRILKTELSFLSRKQLVLGITHAVKINTAVSTGSTYCPPPSSVSLLRSWSEILGCKVGPHFVENAYEFIHDQNTRASKFIRIYIDFRYAGVSSLDPRPFPPPAINIRVTFEPCAELRREKAWKIFIT